MNRSTQRKQRSAANAFSLLPLRPSVQASVFSVGNSVEGGRNGELSGSSIRSYLHVTGNSFLMWPAFQRADDAPSAISHQQAIAFGNVSGNTLLAGESGIVWSDLCTNALVLKNDIWAASGGALDYQGSNGVVRNIQVVKNVLNQGQSYHLKLKYSDSGAFFLQKNTYTNNVSVGDPFIDPASSPVHIMR